VRASSDRDRTRPWRGGDARIQLVICGQQPPKLTEQAVADPVAAELEAALALRRTGADPKALRRALRRIEELLDE
jgi:hypothetical protein